MLATLVMVLQNFVLLLALILFLFFDFIFLFNLFVAIATAAVIVIVVVVVCVSTIIVLPLKNGFFLCRHEFGFFVLCFFFSSFSVFICVFVCLFVCLCCNCWWLFKFQHICFDWQNTVKLLLLLLLNVAFQWSMIFVNFMVVWPNIQKKKKNRMPNNTDSDNNCNNSNNNNNKKKKNHCHLKS